MINHRTIWRIAIIGTLILSSCSFPIFNNRPTDPESLTGIPTADSGLPTSTATLAPTPTPTPEARIDSGDLAILEGDTERARAEYRSGSLDTQDIEIQAAALLGIGRSYIMDREYDLAIENLNALIFEHPANRSVANAYYFLAQAHLAKEEFSLAADAFAKYVELNPGIIDEFIQEERGDALQAAGDFTGAIAAYEAAVAASSGGTGSLRLKIGQAYAASSDHSNAVRVYLDVLETGDNDFQKAQANLLAGQSYLTLGFPEQAYARYLDSVTRFPTAYDSYSGLVTLVNAGIPVSDLDRGIVDYYAGQYGYASEALKRFLDAGGAHTGLPHYLLGLSFRELDEPQAAISAWQALINDHPEDENWIDAWNQIAYTQWAWLDQFDTAAETLLSLVALQPDHPDSAEALFNAGRILERGGRLTRAAEIWERLIDEYPSAEITPYGHLLAGVTYFRLQKFNQAQTVFQRNAVLSVTAEEQSAALMWLGKAQSAMGEPDAARETWLQAAALDPTGYYSQRSSELALGQNVLHEPVQFSLGVDFEGEREDAEDWLQTTFTLPADTDFGTLGVLSEDPQFKRAMALWEIGEYQMARNEYEALRTSLEQDPLYTYRLMNHCLEIGAYRTAIFAARQILTLAGMDNNQTLDAPIYFNHIRFGAYFRELVVEEANRVDFNPLLLLSVIRQESFFEGFVFSGANARGLMQVLPETGQDLVNRYNWPADYTTADLLNPSVNLRLGTTYLFEQYTYFGDLYVALAAYNGGPGNANIWHELAGDDPDLFLEVIRFEETRNYIKNIAEFMNLYRRFYSEP